MQKTYFLALLFGIGFVEASAQTALKIGDALPDFVLPRVVNTRASSFAPASATGKVLVLEFWGTHCSSCIPALQRLDALQQRYPNDLQVVGISEDSEVRLQKFLTKRPLTVPLASAPDEQQDINRLFPHQSVPHTVVVDKSRRVVAITSPDQFDEKTLREVVASRPIHLKLKQDIASADAMSYFAVDSTTRYGLNVRPYIQGLSSQIRNPRKGPFARRRITAINQDAVSLFQTAYEISRFRVQNQLPDSLRQYYDLSLVCFDLIVPASQEATLHVAMQQALHLYLPVQTTWVPATVPAYVLRRRAAGSPIAASTKPETLSNGGGHFEMQGGHIEPLRFYL